MKLKKGTMILCLLLFIMGASILSSSVLAAEDDDYLIPTILRKSIGDLVIDMTVSSAFGHSSNVNSNRYDEDGSSFFQQAFGLSTAYPVSDMYTLRVGYDISTVTYLMFSDPNFISNVLSVGLDAQLLDTLVWSVDYMADFSTFPHDKMSENVINLVETSVKHDLTDYLFHKVGYQFFHKNFHDDNKVRGVMGLPFLAYERKDSRNTVFHQVGLYLGDATLVTADNQIYYNDSHQRFQAYYDYMGYATILEINHVITDKLYSSANFGYEYKAYRKRSQSDKLDHRNTREHIFSYGGSVYYDLTPKVSIGTTIDYIDYNSYENGDTFEDLTITSGVYCFF